MNKATKNLASMLHRHGMHLEQRRKHYAITKNGKTIGSVACSPSDPYFARQTIRMLVQGGHLPEDAKQEKLV